MLAKHMLPKIHIPDYVFGFPEEKQNLWFKDWLIEKQLLSAVVKYELLEISIYFPNKTAELLQLYTREEIKLMDKVYLMLIKRNFILPLRWKTLPDLFKNTGFTPDAIFVFFADDYSILYQEDKDAMTLVNVDTFVQSNLN